MKAKNIVQTCFIVTLIAALAFQTSLPVQAGNFINSPHNLLLVPEAWVDDNYFNGGLNDGHTWGETAFATIQGGVNAVNPGGTVHVAAGTYAEDVQLDKSINLIGDKGDTQPGPGPNAPTIGGCPAGISFCNGITFITTLAAFSNVLIEGFIIRDHPRDIPGDNSGGFGIRVKNESVTPMTNIIIQDNLFIDNRWEALMFFSVGSNPSMYFDNVSALNNRIENTSASATARVGIECTNCRNSLIQGNIIEGKVESGIWIACEATGGNSGFTNGNGLMVTGNTVNGATTAAVELESFDTNDGSTAPVLTGVTISGNTLNRTSSIGTQGSHLIFIHRDHNSISELSKITNITISNNQMDHSYGIYPAIYATVADQITITGNTITATATLYEQTAAILLYNNGLVNLISGNQIHISNYGSMPTSGIALAHNPAFPGYSGNFTISRNTITSDSASGAAGIHLTSSFTGSSAYSVSITNNRISGFINGSKFDNTTDAHVLTIRGNALVGNAGGVLSSLASPLPLENNWWGCNAGPGQTGCDTYSGLVDANPWLMLSFASDVSEMTPGTSQILSANLLFNSNGQDFSALGMDVASTTASFTASLGNFVPTSAPLSLGIASSLYTAPASTGNANICSQVDNQQVCKSLIIGEHVQFLPCIVR